MKEGQAWGIMAGGKVSLITVVQLGNGQTHFSSVSNRYEISRMAFGGVH